MKIYIPERAKSGMGGGFTFTSNIIKKLSNKVDFVSAPEYCDIYFIPGATLADRDEVVKVKGDGKKVVLRVDNIPRNSRNRNTGTSRLYDFAQIADEVVYQSEWAKKWVGPFLRRDGVVIYNGADENIFNPKGLRINKEGSPQYLYSRYNRDETKMWERAWYEFQKTFYINPKAHLWIVGRFGDGHVNYGFDFFGGAEQRYRYLGVIESQEEMAKIYRSSDYLIYSYAMDSCSNVLVEAIMCGTGIMFFGDEDNSAIEIMGVNPKELTLTNMGNKYLKVFESVLKK